jgi:hypothetical protein
MPLSLLRDGAICRCAVVPDGLALSTYTDRHQRRVHIVLDAASERLLLGAQPRKPLRGVGGGTGGRRQGGNSRRGTGRSEPPLAA